MRAVEFTGFNLGIGPQIFPDCLPTWREFGCRGASDQEPSCHRSPGFRSGCRFEEVHISNELKL